MNADYYLRRIYRMLRDDEHKVQLVRFKTFSGQTDFQSVWLDFRRDILPTFMHECLHILYPALSETKIIKLEKSIMSSISNRQAKNILKAMSELL